MATAPNALAIDKIPLPPKRPVEMQVLVLGLSRTGTYCMGLPRFSYLSLGPMMGLPSSLEWLQVPEPWLTCEPSNERCTREAGL